MLSIQVDLNGKSPVYLVIGGIVARVVVDRTSKDRDRNRKGGRRVQMRIEAPADVVILRESLLSPPQLIEMDRRARLNYASQTDTLEGVAKC